jgi:POT family proton-dependent oligopeptide transporter
VTTAIADAAIDHPTALDDTALLGHPRGLGLLFITEMWERFSYYGMRALLILYLTNALGWSDGNAARLYGTYTSLVWLTPLIGGYLADRYIGTRRSLVIGGVIIALGHFVLALQSLKTFYVGLALVIIGTGFFKPNVSTMVGQIYKDGDQRRDSGFTIFYMGINLGAFIAPIICGYLGQRVGWHYGFGAAGIGMTLGLIAYLWGRDRYLPGIGVGTRRAAPAGPASPAPASEIPKANPAHGIIGGVIGLVVGYFVGGGDWLSLCMGAVIGAALGTTVLGSHGEERRRVIALFIVVFFVIFFWMAYEQTGSSMNLFAYRYTRLQVGGFLVPSTWFQSVNSAWLLVLALPMAWAWRRLGELGREPSTALKMVLGLFALGTGFVFMVLAGRSADACIAQQGPALARTACAVASPWWLVLAYLFHTIGELAISPVGLSYVTKVAPWRFGSLLMGVWFLANAAANKIGGTLAALTEKIPSQGQFYTIFLVTSFSAAILMFLLVPLLKSLTRSVRA